MTLTDSQYNALDKLIRNLNLEDILILNADDTDIVFYDNELGDNIPLEEGIDEVLDACVYPFEHNGLTKDEGNAILEIFNKCDLSYDKDMLLASEIPYQVQAGGHTYVFNGYNTDDVEDKFREKFGMDIQIDDIQQLK